MTPERWRQIEKVLAVAVPLQGSGRTSYLTGTCADDADLRREVESLLISHEILAETCTAEGTIAAARAERARDRAGKLASWQAAREMFQKGGHE